jgi:plastocyanin
MKKCYIISLITAVFLGMSFTADATVHMVTVQDFSFSPASMTVVVGDTVMWMWVNGTHTTTDTAIPIGANPWNANLNSSSMSFAYNVLVPGNYGYHCTIHPTLMMGGFNAVLSGISEVKLPPLFNWNISNNQLNIKLDLNSPSLVNIQLYDLLGKPIKTFIPLTNMAGTYSETFSIGNIQHGIYFLELIADDNKIVKKILIQ